MEFTTFSLGIWEKSFIGYAGMSRLNIRIEIRILFCSRALTYLGTPAITVHSFSTYLEHIFSYFVHKNSLHTLNLEFVT